MLVRRPRWGQHFLRDKRVLRRIAASLPLTPGCLVVEIGPGRGALTEELLFRRARVVAIEIDDRLVDALRQKYEQSSAIEIVHEDVLKIDLGGLIAARSAAPAVVTGNLPYYITSPILRKIFGAASHISEAVLLMQEEVARRVVAKKGQKDYAFLSVLCRAYSEPRLLFRVPAKAFQPPPKVTSALVRLTVRPEEKPPPEFIDFLKLCFRQPRKTLLNNLSGDYDRSRLAALDVCRRRAQQLDLEQLEDLWKTVAGFKGR